MTLVVDASVITAALISNEPEGIWAEGVLASDELIAPHLLPVECANNLRLAELRNILTPEQASRALADLLAMRVGLWHFQPFGQRIWQLRQTVTAYDAWYVALAEAFNAELATLDRRLTRAPGVRCRFVTPADGL